MWCSTGTVNLLTNERTLKQYRWEAEEYVAFGMGPVGKQPELKFAYDE